MGRGLDRYRDRRLMVGPVLRRGALVFLTLPVTLTVASLRPQVFSLLLLVVTVTLSVNVPTAPAVKVMLLVPVPPVIVPLVMLQLYVAPTPALATEATLPVEPLAALAGAVIVAFGLGAMVTLAVFEAEQPEALVTTSVRPTVPEAPAV